MENRLSSNDASFDTPVLSGDDDEMMSPLNILKIRHMIQKLLLQMPKLMI
jgi:hypothetical protein